MRMNYEILKEIRNSNFSFNRLAEYYPGLSILKDIPQNPEYHGEGDVYRHTEMVCEKLVTLPEWSGLKKEEQELLFLAAAFHDIGKAYCTRMEGKCGAFLKMPSDDMPPGGTKGQYQKEDGKWVSPRHTIIGEKEFRKIAYREAAQFGLTFLQRETVAKLIRYHGMPVWFWTKKRTEFDLLKAAESIPLRLLYLLSKADVQGRIAKEPEKISENVELFADYAKESGVWEKPYVFANPYTKYQYFHKEELWQDAELYDDTEFDVILMSGLPLAGKDSWILKNGMGMPMISLDGIREQLRIPPAKNSSKVVQTAMEQARDFLRRKEPFIWNATNIIQETRQKLIRLFAGYGARVHILYLEVPYQELLARNQKRTRYIPENVLEDMIRKLEIPAPWEAYEVKLFT